MVVTVLTLGASSHELGLATITAAVALTLVAIVGAIVAKQLSGVPENAMKMAVGIMLVSYGTFWTGEGLKVSWPGNDVMIPVFVVLYALFVWVVVASLKTGEMKAEVA